MVPPKQRANELPLTLPWRTFSSIAVSWAESILAMLLALAPVSQLLKAVLPALTCDVVKPTPQAAPETGSKSDPLALRRCSDVRKQRSEAVSNSWPFLLLQKPSVRPPLGDFQ